MSEVSGNNTSRVRLSYWLRIGKHLTRWPWCVIIPLVIYLLASPAIAQLRLYSERYDNELTFPRSGSSTAAYKQFRQVYPPGIVNPFYVLIGSQNQQPIDTHGIFQSACEVAKQMIQFTAGKPYALRPEDLLGVAFFPDRKDVTQLLCVGWDTKGPKHEYLPLTAKQMLDPERVDNIGLAYKEFWNQATNVAKTAMLITVRPNFDPFGEHVKDFITDLRAALHHCSGMLATEGAAVYLFSPLVTVYDIVKETYAWMPLIVGTTLVVVFVLIAFAFSAVFAPFKLFFTVVIPIIALYGLATAVYQEGLLDWTNITPLMSTDGVFWANPVFTCTLLIGLALDYDIFLFARVLELRKQGFDNRAAILGGLYLTGPIITSAGLIMATAFAGLLLTEVPSTNQIGFFLCVGVLLDTFVVRVCLVPAILMLVSGLNYWPQRMPDPDKGVSELIEFLSHRAVPELKDVEPDPMSSVRSYGMVQSERPRAMSVASDE